MMISESLVCNSIFFLFLPAGHMSDGPPGPRAGAQRGAAAVKMCLLKQLADSDILPTIRQWVDRVSFLAWRASLLLNLYMLDLLENNRPLPDDMDKDSFWYTFWTYPEMPTCSRTTADVHAVRHFLSGIWDCVPVDDVLQYSIEIKQTVLYAAKQYKTNARNGFEFGIEAKMTRYVCECVSEATRKAAKISARSIAWDILRKDQQGIYNKDNQEILAFIMQERTVYWAYASRWHRWIHCAHRLQQFFAAKKLAAGPQGKGYRLFNLFPEHRVRQLFIRIDDVSADCIKPGAAVHDFFYWKGSYKSVVTDGTSIVFTAAFEEESARAHDPDGELDVAPPPAKKKRLKDVTPEELQAHEEERKEKRKIYSKEYAQKRKREKDAAKADADRVKAGIALEIPPGWRLVGVDPGRRNIVTTFDGTRVKKFTRAEWYHYTGFTEFTRWTNKRQNRNPAVKMALESLAVMEQETPSVNFAAYRQKLVWFREQWTVLWNFFTSRRFARHRFRVYRQKQSAMERLLDVVVPRNEADTTVIAYGDASFNSHGVKGERAVPVKAHRRALGRRSMLLHDVDEFRSTMLCCDCHQPLVEPKLRFDSHAPRRLRENAARRTQHYTPHGLRHCKTANCANRLRRYVSRDGNAARNIRQFWLLRPRQACRDFKFPAQGQQQQVGQLDAASILELADGPAMAESA